MAMMSILPDVHPVTQTDVTVLTLADVALGVAGAPPEPVKPC